MATCYCIPESWEFEQETTYTIKESWVHKTSNYVITEYWDFNPIGEHTIVEGWRHGAYAQEFHDGFTPPGDTPPSHTLPHPGGGGSVTTAENFYNYKYQVNFIGASTHDMTQYVTSWKISEKRSSPLTANITFVDINGDFAPAGGTLSNELKGRYPDQYYWQIKVKTADKTWTSPRLVQLDYDYILDGNAAIVSVSCTDLSERLVASKDDAMEDFVATGGATVSAKTTAKAILDAYSVQSRLEFTDYQMEKFSPKGGQPIDWVKELLSYANADWFFDEDQFVAFDCRYSLGALDFDWVIKHRFQLFNFKLKYAARNVFNEFLVNKQVPGTGILAHETRSGRNILGFNTISWSDPCGAASIVVSDIAWGRCYSYAWYDINGEPPGGQVGRPSILCPSNPVTSVQFIYEPYINWPPSLIPHFTATVYGMPISAGPIVGSQTGFKKIARDVTHQSYFGVKKAPPIVAAGLILTEEHAERYANYLLTESLRQGCVVNFDAILNPFIRPCDLVKVECDIAGFGSGKVIYVETVDKNSDGTMSIEGTCTPS